MVPLDGVLSNSTFHGVPSIRRSAVDGAHEGVCSVHYLLSTVYFVRSTLDSLLSTTLDYLDRLDGLWFERAKVKRDS